MQALYLKNMDTDKKINFLYKSIEDTQSIIKAIDVKLGFLFVVIFLPITTLEKIVAIGLGLAQASCWYQIPIAIILLLWSSALYLLFKGVIAISNPGSYINESEVKGVFYNPSLFDFSLIDYFFNFPIKSNKTLKESESDLPDSCEKLINELVYEQMKLVYIRDIKIRRSKLCAKLIFYSLVLGVFCWLVFLLGVGINAD